MKKGIGYLGFLLMVLCFVLGIIVEHGTVKADSKESTSAPVTYHGKPVLKIDCSGMIVNCQLTDGTLYVMGNSVVEPYKEDVKDVSGAYRWTCPSYTVAVHPWEPNAEKPICIIKY